MILFIISILCAYLLGSVPSAVWISKIFYNIDIREHGSGNAGTANTFRVLGAKAGIPVFIIDVLKGTLAVLLSFLFFNKDIYGLNFIEIKLILGLSALVGHIFPVFANFKGGKGVATLLGVMLIIQPLPTLCSLATFIIILLTFRYVSLSSILSGVSFPFYLIFIFKSDNISLISFSILIALILLITHHKNIKRLLEGEEPKVKIFRGNKNNNNTNL
jgi:glycerol-3-phosphate acyltransferase PlsY